MLDPESPISYAARIAALAAAHPERVALHFVAIDGGEQALTWRDLDRRSTQLAHAFAARGLTVGDRLALGIRNSPELVTSILAGWKLGATPVPVRWDLPEWERARVLKVIDARVAIGGYDLPWLRSTESDDTTPLPDVVAPLTYGICSSGSTGMPKVILIDRPSLFDEATGQPFPSSWREMPRPQVILVPAPLYHANGFLTLPSLLAGDVLIVMEKFHAARIVDLIERHRVTTFTATPTMLQRIADLPGVDERDLSSIEWVLQGAAVIAPSLVHRMISLFGAEKFFMRMA